MSKLPSNARIVIVGGGVMGLFTAWECATRGETDIVILEQRKFLGAGATQKSAGGVRAQFTTAPNVMLSKYSQDFYRRRFAPEINPDFQYLEYGYLFFARSEEKLKALDNSLALQKKQGVDAVRRISPSEIREILPDLNISDVLGGNFSPEDGFVDPGDIVNGLDTSLRKFGVDIFTDCEVAGIDSISDFNFVVKTELGNISAEKILVATGSWSGEFMRKCGVKVPVDPYRRSLYISGPLPWFPKKSPFTFDICTGTHFRPESGGILFLKINPNEGPSHNEEPDWDWLEHIVPDLIHIMPRLEDAEIIDAWAGPYAMTPDHSPILGEIPASPSGVKKGIYIVTGFSGHGLMHAPASACAMSEYLLDLKTSTLDVSAYSLERYEKGELIEEAAVF
ncbi:MAG: FAD-binding oxidoreductase [bacterium]|nr:FAD-binding oxidoreductase [bacterium]